MLILLAKRLPPGILRELAAFIPDCVNTVRLLRNDPRVPRSAKIAVLIAGVWVASPIDLTPEFLPVIGPLDDIVVVAPPSHFVDPPDKSQPLSSWRRAVASI